MSTTVVTPFSRSQAIELAGNLWRKKLLPVGTITYRGPGAPPEGRKIHFTREYLRGLAEAFRSRAYDQVPFQIAGDDNKHTNAVERYRGEILDLDLADDGLYCVARVTPGGEKILSENPNLGVSARIREDYARSDGEFFPAAIQHVLGTLDPHVPQLGPWQAVDLANSNSGRVIDLSGCQFDGEAGGGLSDAEMDTVLGRIGALQSAGLLGDDLAYIKAVMAEADAIEAAGLDYVEASNIASNIAGMTHQVATAAAMAGDFELAVNCYLDLSGQSAGSGSVELASRAPSGRFSGACGAADPDNGLCLERFHSAGCVHNLIAQTPPEAQRLSPYYADGNGRSWQTADGHAASVRDIIEATAGQRLFSSGAFEPGTAQQAARDGRPPRHQPAVIERVLHDPETGVEAIGQATRTEAGRIASALGLDGPARQRQAQREHALAQRERYDQWKAQHPQVRLEHGADGSRAFPERAASPVPYGDGALGSLVGLTYG